MPNFSRNFIALSLTLALASPLLGQNADSQDTTVRPAVAFPPTPTPAPKEEPMTQEQLDDFLIPKDYLARTSDVLCIIYNGFRRSQIDPCGCVTHQLGGLDKEARLVHRIEEHKIPAVLVDAGGFVRDMPDEKALEQSKALLTGLGQMGYLAVNVAFTDLALTPAELQETAKAAGVELVSANLLDENGEPVFAPYVVKEVVLADGSALKVGVIGVTRPRVEMSARSVDEPSTVTAGATRGNPVTLKISDPLQALNKYAAELAEKADFVIGLDYDRRSNVERIVKGLMDKKVIDVMVLGENSQIQGNVQALEGIQVVSGGYEGRQMGTLYVELKDKAVASTWNRHIEVLQTIPPLEKITQLMEETHKKIEQTGAPKPAVAPTKLEL